MLFFKQVFVAASVCAVGVCSIALGQQAPSPDPGVADLERVLKQEDSIAAVSRVMGYRIVASAVKPYMHGTLVGDWTWRDGAQPLPNTFELREAHLYFGAHILEVAQPEVFVQFEHHSQTDSGFSVRYAQLDVSAYKELLVFRIGLFLVPFGVYNTDLFLRYVAKLPERPEIHRRLVPSAWNEVGIQARGRWSWGQGRALSYAFYLSNGLFLPAGTSATSTVQPSAAIRSPAGGKSFGGRVGVDLFEGLSIGLSGYNGALNGENGAYQLVGLDAIFRYGPFSLDCEALTGRESVTDSDVVTKQGYYVAVGYRATNWFEPVASIERVNATVIYQASDVWGGFNVYPFPVGFPTLVLKAAYGRRIPTSGPASNMVTIQMVLGY